MLIINSSNVELTVLDSIDWNAQHFPAVTAVTAGLHGHEVSVDVVAVCVAMLYCTTTG